MFGGDSSAAPPSSDVAELVSEGAGELQAGEYKDAFKHFQLADKRSQGESWDAVAGAATAALRLGKASRAHEYAERLLEMDQSPRRKGTALYLLGVSLAGLNKLSESEVTLRQFLDLVPDAPFQTRTVLVSVMCRQNKHDEALALLDEQGLCAERADEPATDGPPQFEPGGKITEPVKLSGPYPEYPEQDRLARIQGTVVLDSLIGTDGTIHCVRVLDGPSPAMGCSAAVAVMNWKFQPSTLDGEVVEVYYNLAVRFQLR